MEFHSCGFKQQKKCGEDIITIIGMDKLRWKHSVLRGAKVGYSEDSQTYWDTKSCFKSATQRTDQASNQLYQACAEWWDKDAMFRAHMIQQGETKEGTRGELVHQRRARPMCYQKRMRHFSAPGICNRKRIQADTPYKRVNTQSSMRQLTHPISILITNLHHLLLRHGNQGRQDDFSLP